MVILLDDDDACTNNDDDASVDSSDVRSAVLSAGSSSCGFFA